MTLNFFVSLDFKYYEDPGDEFRDSTGQLLPLWRFKYEKARKSAVTALSWNPLYKDLFAVGHGTCKKHILCTCQIYCIEQFCRVYFAGKCIAANFKGGEANLQVYLCIHVCILKPLQMSSVVSMLVIFVSTLSRTPPFQSKFDTVNWSEFDNISGLIVRLLCLMVFFMLQNSSPILFERLYFSDQFFITLIFADSAHYERIFSFLPSIAFNIVAS